MLGLGIGRRVSGRRAVGRVARAVLRVAAGLIGLATCLLLGACVSAEHREAKAARRAYLDCLARNPRDTERCESERQAYNVAVDRYEENSRRAWSCDPAQEECPTRR